MNTLDRAKLKERARRLAQRPDSEHERQIEVEVAVILIGEEKIGIPVNLLREIVRMPAVTALPSLPAHFRGLVQIRGELVTVIDLGHLLDLSSSRHDGLLVIVDQDGRSLGLAVDGLAEFREIHRDEMATEFDEGSRRGSRLLQATTRDLLSILDSQQLLDDDRIAVRTTQTTTSKAVGGSDALDRSPLNPSLEGGTP